MQRLYISMGQKEEKIHTTVDAETILKNTIVKLYTKTWKNKFKLLLKVNLRFQIFILQFMLLGVSVLISIQHVLTGARKCPNRI